MNRVILLILGLFITACTPSQYVLDARARIIERDKKAIDVNPSPSVETLKILSKSYKQYKYLPSIQISTTESGINRVEKLLYGRKHELYLEPRNQIPVYINTSLTNITEIVVVMESPEYIKNSRIHPMIIGKYNTSNNYSGHLAFRMNMLMVTNNRDALVWVFIKTSVGTFANAFYLDAHPHHQYLEWGKCAPNNAPVWDAVLYRACTPQL